jgi:stage II sporulation protein R
MKKYLIICIIIILFILIIPKKEEELRIRVIANSNTEVDQKIKMEVANAIIDEITTYNEINIVNEVKNNLEEIDKIIQDILKDEEYSITLKKTRFPPKELNGEIIKGGKYLTLLITIKNGEGKNWWSLLSPRFKYGFSDDATGDVEFKFYFLKLFQNDNKKDDK